MTEQLSLLSEHRNALTRTVRYTPQEIRPLAKHAQAGGSHAAAEAIVESGTHRSQLEAVLQALARYTFAGTALEVPISSRALAEKAHLDRHMVARRLPDLTECSFAAKAVESIGKEARWYVTSLGRRALALGLPIVKPERARKRETP